MSRDDHHGPPDVLTTRLGYGCASLMARTRRRASVRLLHAALDAGVTHFDVARSYGYGEAESAVGDFLSGRRDAVTVTTKFGIAPPRRSGTLTVAKALAGTATRAVPALRPLVRSRAARLVVHGDFSLSAARQSVERSLRELRTDYVDVLLAHEIRPDDLQDDLLSFLEECVHSGKARAVGVATDRASAAELAERAPLLGQVVQSPDSILDAQTLPAAVPMATTWITHSGLGTTLASVDAHLARVELRRQWSEQVGLELADPAALPRLMLACALQRNPMGVVLVSSRSAAHLRDNVAVLADPPPHAALETFQRLVAEL